MVNILKVIDNWAIIGRPGYAGKKKQLRRLELQEKFGEGNWKIAHLVDNNLLSREEALVYFEDSYLYFFQNNPEILDWLVSTAKDVYDNNLTNIKSGLNYLIQETPDSHLQDIAIRRVLKRLNRIFSGNNFLQIREECEGSILSTGQVPFYKPDLILQPQLKGWWSKNSIESFWQSNKVLAIKIDKLKTISSSMVGVILRKDIQMGKGKFCVQTAHALVSLLPQRNIKWDFYKNPVEIWAVKSDDDLLNLYHKAMKLAINTSIISDAGKTQLVPGTRTAVGFGPVNEAIFDLLMYEFNAEAIEKKERIYRTFKNLTLFPF